MIAQPLIVLNGFPGVGKSSVASALRDRIPGSKFLPSHLLIDPAAAMLGREEDGYRDLRKAFRAPMLDSIARNPSLLGRPFITTYYQETLENRDIDLKEYFASAQFGKRTFIVIVLHCSPEENFKRLVSRSKAGPSPTDRLTDVNILKDIRKNHFVYRFYDHGYVAPHVWEFNLDIENITPEEAAQEILKCIGPITGF